MRLAPHRLADDGTHPCKIAKVPSHGRTAAEQIARVGRVHLESHAGGHRHQQAAVDLFGPEVQGCSVTRGSLFRKYALVLAGLVSLALVASGAMQALFS